MHAITLHGKMHDNSDFMNGIHSFRKLVNYDVVEEDMRIQDVSPRDTTSAGVHNNWNSIGNDINLSTYGTEIV